jgi:hypothetical protein
MARDFRDQREAGHSAKLLKVSPDPARIKADLELISGNCRKLTAKRLKVKGANVHRPL